MNSIVIVDENWGIGRDNDLLIHLPTELKYFKEKTEGKVIVIGRKTLESFPNKKPLPNRTNIVLTRDETFANDSVVVCVGEEALKQELEKYSDEDIFISGGAQVYKQFLNQCDHIYVTKIFSSFPADRYFENLDEREDFKIGWTGPCHKENGVEFQFLRYDKVK